MPQCLVVILHKTSNLPELLDTWQGIGIPGVTILEGAGGYRANQHLKKVRLRTSLGNLFKSDELQSKTLIAVIDEDDLMERAIIETERIIGDFNDSETGLMFTMPVNQVVGLLRLENRETGITVRSATPESMTDTGIITRNTSVMMVNEILNLEPVVVEADCPLLNIVDDMVAKPNVDMACVIKQQRLVGLMPLQSLADDLFMMIVPEGFLSEARDTESTLHYAKLASTQTVEDAMIDPVFVKEDATVKEAFQKMHDNQLSGIPIVNDKYEITGYINLLELLAIYARSQKSSES